jgi:hypothetical protein
MIPNIQSKHMKMNMKKVYMEPTVKVLSADLEEMIAATQLDPNKDNQEITPTDEPYDGEFGAKKFHSVWDE